MVKKERGRVTVRVRFRAVRVRIRDIVIRDTEEEQARQHMCIRKRSGWQRGPVAARDLSAVGGDAVLLFLMTAQMEGAAYSVIGGALYWFQWRRRKGKLAQIVKKCNEYRINNKTKLTPPLFMRAKEIPNPAKTLYAPLYFLALSVICWVFVRAIFLGNPETPLDIYR